MPIEGGRERDSLARQEVLERISRQMTRAERESRAVYVIINDGSIEELEQKALKLLSLIMRKGQE